jgi:solute carrier family 24 (sodium/potassium/calcium exchanger), member 6
VVPILYALISGLVALALLLTFSSPNKPPRWHKTLCAVGFVVGIGWISTIADEVVGILRAFGAIVGVSEAILGVTVFAMVISPLKLSHDRETLYQIS